MNIQATLSPVIGRTPDVPSSIRMYPAGEAIYIAFCDNSSHPHYLEVAGTLYVFMQRGLDVDGVVSAISTVVDRLPVNSNHYGCLVDDLIEPAWIAQFVIAESDQPSLHPAFSPNVRRPI